MSEFWKPDPATNAADECDRLEAENDRLRREMKQAIEAALHEERVAIQHRLAGIDLRNGDGWKRPIDIVTDACKLITARIAHDTNPLAGWLPPHQVAQVRGAVLHGLELASDKPGHTALCKAAPKLNGGECHCWRACASVLSDALAILGDKP